MTDDKSGGWLRSIFKRGPEEPALPPPPAPKITSSAELFAPAARRPPVEPPAPVERPAAVQSPAPPAAQPPASLAVGYFRLQSTQGRFLVLKPGDAELGASEMLDPAWAVLAIVPEAHPHLCLLAAPDGRPFHLAGDSLTGIGISARILRSTIRGIVRFKQPLSGMRFLTLEDDEPIPHFDRPGDTVAAAFQMLPVRLGDVPGVVRGIAEDFGAMLGTGLGQRALMAALGDARRAGRDLAGALLRLLPRDELDDLSRRLLDEPPTLAQLRSLLPTDPYAQTYLPQLVAWRAARGPVSADGQLKSPGAEEVLIMPCANEAGVPAGLALHALARGHVSPRRGFCIVAPARNEGPYLLEWLAHHLAIGFEHFFIYTNDNSDGSDELLALLARHGVITLVHNERGQRIGVQEKATAHALTLVPQTLDYRWTAVMDIDEYFCFDSSVYESLADFIALHEAQPVDALALCWIIFASKFGEPYRKGLTTERFTWRSREIDRHVKCMFRTRQFWGSQPHYPYPTLEAPFLFRTEEGDWHHHPGVKDRIAAFSETPSAAHGWINHYVFRSAPEALWKLARGSVAWLPKHDVSERPVMEHWITKAFTDFATSPALVHDTRIAACGRGQKAALEKLRALPGVAELDDTIRFNFEIKLKKLSDKFLGAQLPPNAHAALLQFREALLMSQGMPPMPVVQPVLSPIV
jgi:hypothetical protein